MATEDPASEAAPSEAAPELASAPLGETLRVVARRARPYARSFVAIALLAALSSLAAVVAPLVYRFAINDLAGLFVRQAQVDLVEEQDLPALGEPHGPGRIAARAPEQVVSSLFVAVAVLLVLRVVGQAAGLLADGVATRVGSRVERSIITEAFEGLLRRPLRFFSGRSSTALGKRVYVLDEAAPLVAALSKDLLPEVFRVGGILVVILAVNPALAALALLPVPFYLWLSLRMNRGLAATQTGYFDAWDGASARLADALSGARTVKLAGAESRESERLGEALTTGYEKHLSRNALENRFLIAQGIVVQIGHALVLAFGGWKVLSHQLTPGDVVMFVAYLDELFGPLEDLAHGAVRVRAHLDALARAVPFLTAGERERGAPLPKGTGHVVFENVSFGYGPEREVLRRVSFEIAPGSVTALVGPSGAGKTTLVDLLLRLYAPGSGRILLDGRPLEELDPAALRSEVAVVSADGALFRGSIEENVRYMRPSASPEDVGAAVKAAGLEPALARFPDGLATTVGEGGAGLSMGERQRILLARALVSRPRVLILDEATANLDFETERAVRSALEVIRKGRTLLVIAHRPSMVLGAQHVVVLEDGTVAESGPPADLVTRGGWFSRFVESGNQDETSIVREAC